MAKVEFDIKDVRKEMNPMDVYAVITCSIEDNEIYESALRHNESCGLYSVYRDGQTTATILVYSESSGGANDWAYLGIWGEEDKLMETLNGIKSIIPKRFNLEKIAEEVKK